MPTTGQSEGEPFFATACEDGRRRRRERKHEGDTRAEGLGGKEGGQEESRRGEGRKEGKRRWKDRQKGRRRGERERTDQGEGGQGEKERMEEGGKEGRKLWIEGEWEEGRKEYTGEGRGEGQGRSGMSQGNGGGRGRGRGRRPAGWRPKGEAVASPPTRPRGEVGIAPHLRVLPAAVVEHLLCDGVDIPPEALPLGDCELPQAALAEKVGVGFDYLRETDEVELLQATQSPGRNGRESQEHCRGKRPVSPLPTSPYLHKISPCAFPPDLAGRGGCSLSSAKAK